MRYLRPAICLLLAVACGFAGDEKKKKSGGTTTPTELSIPSDWNGDSDYLQSTFKIEDAP
jgi:hypothetical protein